MIAGNSGNKELPFVNNCQGKVRNIASVELKMQEKKCVYVQNPERKLRRKENTIKEWNNEDRTRRQLFGSDGEMVK